LHTNTDGSESIEQTRMENYFEPSLVGACSHLTEPPTVDEVDSESSKRVGLHAVTR